MAKFVYKEGEQTTIHFDELESTHSEWITFPDGQSARIYMDESNLIVAAFDISGDEIDNSHWSFLTGNCDSWDTIFAVERQDA